ncbi:MAG: cation transporter [Candidatus Omnitrophica bacterium]|nr:cation transporter [Candidatus Omnitrophota bacterium]
MTRIQRGIKVTLVTIAVNMVLAFIKVFTGLIGHSYALVADGVESVTDVFTSIVVFGGFKIGAKPPDENHPWGHGKAESLAALFVALILCIVAVGIAIQSIKEIASPGFAPAAYTLIVLVGVIFSKELLFRFLLKKSKDLDSLALKADAWHSRSDSLTSLAAFIGISISLLGGEKYVSADNWAALFASGIILFNGLKILKSATNELMDTMPDPEVEARIRDIAKGVEGVTGVEKCRVRQSGPGFFLEVHIEVDGNISVYHGHETAHQVKKALMESDLGVIDAVIHIEPADSQGT